MFKSNRFLLYIFIVLLLVLLGETGYFFYYQLETKNKPSQAPIITPTVTIESQDLIKGEADLVGLISRVESNKNLLINGIDYLEKENPSLQCSLDPFCVEIDNKESLWAQYDTRSHAININTPFLIKLLLKNKNGLAGISLNGRISLPTGPLWKNVFNIFIGLKDNGTRLYLDAQNGTSETAFVLLDKEVTNIALLNIFFSKSGKYILITDEQYQTLAYLDINQITNNQFPNGLFPDGKIYLGAGVAPDSYLALMSFSIIPIEN